MPNVIRVAAFLLLVVPSQLSAQAHDAHAEDREAVREVILNYVEAIYENDPARIERSVRPDLTKFGYYRRPDAREYTAAPMTYEQLMQTARTYNRTGRDLSTAPRLITVLDVLDQIAAARLVASWGVDYFHLVKTDGTWKILHVVWQSHSPETAAAAREAIRDPAEGAKQGEGSD